jgi:hypothetical protein
VLQPAGKVCDGARGGEMEMSWMSEEELIALAGASDSSGSAGSREFDGRELAWIRMWQTQRDEFGHPVRRGYGVAVTGDAGDFINYNNQGPNGNHAGALRILRTHRLAGKVIRTWARFLGTERV